MITIFMFTALNSFAGVSFKKDLFPILEDKCIKCHTPPYKDKKGKLKKPKAGLIMTTYKDLMKGSEDGKIIEPGKPEKSSMYTLSSLDPEDEDVMPPKGEPLTTAEIKTIKDWIAEGAKDN